MGRAESSRRQLGRCEYRLDDVHSSEVAHIKAKNPMFLEVMNEEWSTRTKPQYKFMGSSGKLCSGIGNTRLIRDT